MQLRAPVILVMVATAFPWLGCSDKEEKATASGGSSGHPGTGGSTAGRPAGQGNQQSGGGAGGRSDTSAEPERGGSGDAGADEDTAGHGGESGAPTDHPMRLLYAVVCEAYRNCCMASGFDAGGLVGCEDALVARAGRSYLEAYEAGTLVFDAAAIAACATALRAGGDGCDLLAGLELEKRLVTLPDCAAAFIGKVPAGGTCDVDEECEGTAQVKCVNNICGETPPGKPGDRCVMTQGPWARWSVPDGAAAAGGARCMMADGLYCARVSDTVYKCAPVKADGASCTEVDSCGADSFCDQTCKPLKAVGESCTLARQCRGFGCADTSRCAQTLPQALCEDTGIQ
jgi:hypothetical protein